MNAIVIMSLVTSIFALLTCVYTMANQTYPDALRRAMGANNLFVPVLTYVAITVCAAITLWETWKSNVGGGGGGFSS